MTYTKSGWQRRHDDRIADLDWFAENNVGAHEAARQMHMRYKSLEEWCRRHALGVWHQLRDNETRHTGGCRLATRRTLRKAS